jgi:hypothetical protein
MATTARALIRRALKLCQVVDEDEQPQASQSADALDSLNDMAAGLKTQGANLDWQPLGLSDDVPVAPEHIDDLKYLLARTLAPEYGVELRPEVALRAQQGESSLIAHFARVGKLGTDPSYIDRLDRYGYDINSDGFNG